MIKEGEPIPLPINLEFLNDHKLNLEKIKELQRQGFIKRGSPHWWSTDYAPDPREFLSVEELLKRLVPVEENGRAQFYLYPHRFVPIAVVDLSIDGDNLPFMVTARPYHPASTNLVEPDSLESRMDTPISDVPQKLRELRSQFLTYHCVPHVHGLFVGARGTHLFWYSLKDTPFIPKIGVALENKGLTEIFPSTIIPIVGGEIRSYFGVADEIIEKEVVAGKPVRPDFPYEEVCVDEFLSSQNKGDLLIYYPLRLPGLQETLPLMIATRTHLRSRQSSLVVLGISAGTKKYHGENDYLWRIKDNNFARAIAAAISLDFQTKVDCVLFNPQGKLQYERVSA